MEDFIRVGVAVSTHGLKGEMKVYPTTDDAQRFLDLRDVYIGSPHEKLCVEGARFFKNMVIVKFKGLDRIEDVERLKGLDIFVSREDAVPLEEGEYYYADLIGMKVYLSDGGYFGILKDILETGANDVYIINSEEHGEVLVPAIDDCIKDVNIEEDTMIIDLLPGLLDLSRS